ncbi:MAG: VCBS repeat-containing protein [Planctomycetes bacterium]|nr:VCBS repeat-containing protein [Planctomycetota bacterium]
MLHRCVALALLLAFAGGRLEGQKQGPGSTLWTFDTRAPSFGSGAAGDIDGDGKPEVVFGTYFNGEHVYALNGEDGSLAWKFKSRGGPIDTSILIHDVNGDQKLEVIFGDSARGVLFCLDGAGKEVWTFQGQSGTDSPAAAADLDGDGTVEVVYGTMKVRRGGARVNVLAGKTGQLVWSVEVPGHVQSEPGLVDVNGDGVLDVLVTSWRGDDRLRALSGKDGTELWHFEVGDWVYHGVSFHDFDRDRRPEIVVADRKGSVWLLAGETGKPVWKAGIEGEKPGQVFGPTTLVDSNGNGVPEIAVAGRNLHLLDARTGKVRWRTNLPGKTTIMRGAATADVNGDGKPELVFAQDRTVYVLAAATGKILWTRSVAVRNDPQEYIKSAPLLVDLDGDGRLDIFMVTGRADGRRPQREQNYGQAFALRGGAPRAGQALPWLTFRGSPRRGGQVLPPDPPARREL